MLFELTHKEKMRKVGNFRNVKMLSFHDEMLCYEKEHMNNLNHTCISYAYTNVLSLQISSFFERKCQHV